VATITPSSNVFADNGTVKMLRAELIREGIQSLEHIPTAALLAHLQYADDELADLIGDEIMYNRGDAPNESKV